MNTEGNRVVFQRHQFVMRVLVDEYHVRSLKLRRLLIDRDSQGARSQQCQVVKLVGVAVFNVSGFIEVHHP
jgi:hypothetical protein